MRLVTCRNSIVQAAYQHHSLVACSVFSARQAIIIIVHPDWNSVSSTTGETSDREYLQYTVSQNDLKVDHFNLVWWQGLVDS